jgi:hypothetical protein
MPTINIEPKAMQNGDNVTTYKDTVGPQQQTYTFLTSQERVILKNSGSKNITYTVGSQSGTLGPSQMVDVKETISSINLTAEQGTQQFEIWADESGTKGTSPEAVQSLGDQVSGFASSLATSTSDLKQRGINVKQYPYYASGSVQTTTGSITSGSNSLNVGNPIDFKIGQGIAIQTVSPVTDVKSLTITANANASGNISISFDSAAYIIPVNLGDTTIQIADRIRSSLFNGWITGGTVGTNIVTFTASDAGEKPSMSYDPSTTGATGAITVTITGIKPSYFVSTITGINGNVLTLQNNATSTVSNGLILHDDTTAIQSAINDIPSDGGELILPKGTFNYSSNLTISDKNYITFRGVGHETILYALVANNTALYVNNCSNTVVRDFKLISSGTKRLQSDSSIGIRPSNSIDLKIKSVYVERTTGGILSRQCTNILIENCKVKDTFADGIHFTERCKNVKALNNHLENTGDDSIAVVSYTKDGNSSEVTSLNVTSGAVTTGSVLISLDGSVSIVNVTAGDTPTTIATNIRTTTFSGWTTGGSGTTVTFTNTSNGNRTDAFFNANGSGVIATISTSTQGDGYVERVIISNNIILNGKTRGITHVGGKNVVISNNIINGTASSGILVMKDNNYGTFEPLDTIITNNQIKNVGIVLPNAGNVAGIELQVDTKGCLVENNVITHGLNRGLLISGSGVIIKGNYIYRNFGPNQVGPSNQVIISGNHFEENGEQGLSVINCFNPIITDNISLNNNTKKLAGVDNFYFTGCSKGHVANNNSIDSRSPARIERNYEYNNCSSMTISGNRNEGGSGIAFSGTSSSISVVEGATGSGVPTATYYSIGQKYTDTTNGNVYLYLNSVWKLVSAS